MQKALSNLPVFDRETFAQYIAEWKPVVNKARPGMNRMVIEWCVIRGPSCFVYPASQRNLGTDLCADGINRTSDERWADFLEFTFVPEVVTVLTEAGLNPQIICVDLRPVQVQRQRRRAIAAAARAKSGEAAHH